MASSYFYPRPPYGGRPEDGAPVAVIDEISIHVPRMGGRPATPCGILSSLYFYPRPPYGGRPSTFRQYLSRCPNFYPRPPYGGRRRAVVHIFAHVDFYPRPPYGGRRCLTAISTRNTIFLSTSPVWGTTDLPRFLNASDREFLSTSPVWGTTRRSAARSTTWLFLSTSPVWGTTWPGLHGRQGKRISIHVPRMGDDHWGSSFAQNGMSISIHVPRMGDDGKYPKTKVI